MAPGLACRQHAPRAFLGPEEHRIEIGGEHAPPLRLRQVERAGRVTDAGIVDQDGDGAERRLGGVEGAPHRRVVEHVGRDRHGPAAGRLDLRLQGGETLLAAGDEGDRRAVRRQHLGKAQPQPARRAGNEADPAAQIEQFGCLHTQRAPRNAGGEASRISALPPSGECMHLGGTSARPISRGFCTRRKRPYIRAASGVLP